MTPSATAATATDRVGADRRTKRIVILGNSGAGKSYLARSLAKAFDSPVIELDTLFWMPGGFETKRSPNEIDRLISGHRTEPAWIVEGVFGELVLRFLDLADLLVWLDLPPDVCRAGLLERGPDSAAAMDSSRAEQNFTKLLAWSADYWTRADSRSFAGHERIFAAFEREKRRIRARSEVDAFATEMIGREHRDGRSSLRAG